MDSDHPNETQDPENGPQRTTTRKEEEYEHHHSKAFNVFINSELNDTNSPAHL